MLYGLTTEKETLFQGKTERFNNTYYFDGPSFQFGDANFVRLADAVIDAERNIHNSEVKFVQARLWSAGGTIAENETLLIKDYTDLGVSGSTTPLHAETAVMVEWECDRKDARGRKVYLRKYLRTQTLPGGTSEIARGKAALGSSSKVPFKTYADKVQSVQMVDNTVRFNLISPGGRSPKAAANGAADAYVRNREFRRN